METLCRFLSELNSLTYFLKYICSVHEGMINNMNSIASDIRKTKYIFIDKRKTN